MKRDEIKAVFPDATEAQIDAILSSAGRDLTELHERFDKAEEKYKETTSALEEARQKALDDALTIRDLKAKAEAGMSAEELLAQREQQASEREREFMLKSNALDARSVFVEAGFSEEEYAPLVEQIVSDDSEKTVAIAKQIAALTASQREQAAVEAKDALLKANPKFKGTGGDGSPTKEEFDALPVEEQVKIVEANPAYLDSLK